MITRTQPNRLQATRSQVNRPMVERDQAEVSTFFRNLELTGGTFTDTEARAISRAVGYLYKLNLRQYIDELCVFAGSNTSTILVKLFKGPNSTSNNLTVNSGTITRTSVGLGAANTIAVQFNLNASVYANNNFSLFYFKYNNVFNNSSRIFGSNQTGLSLVNLNEQLAWSVGNMNHPFNGGQGVASGAHVLFTNGNSDKYWLRNGRLFNKESIPLSPSNFGLGQMIINERVNGGCSVAGTGFGMTLQQGLDISKILCDMDIERGRLSPLSEIRLPTYIFHGDSLTAGWIPIAPGELTTPWPERAMLTLGRNNLTATGAITVNLALSGKRLISNVGSNISVTNLYDSDTRLLNTYNFNNLARVNVVTIWAGTNDFGGANSSSATVKTALDSLCQKLKKQGFKVIVATYIPSSTYAGFPFLANYNTEAPLCNAALVADANYSNGVLADALFRVDSIPECADPNNTTYFHDGIHPTQALANIIGNAYAALITSLGF